MEDKAAYIIRETVRLVPELLPLLSVKARAAVIAMNYPSARKTYYENVFASVYDYLDTGRVVFRNDMRRAAAEAFVNAGEIGYTDGGAELPMPPELSEWIGAEQEAEFGNIASLFETLKAMRKAGDVDKTAEATKRAEGYAYTLDRIYAHAKTVAAGNMMLTFEGTDGAVSCADCQKYKGKRHKASWWVSHNAIPPSRDFICGGWQCFHYLVDDNGKQWTG